ncbi:MAG: cytochrome b, partial [Novosphingobium sp.]
MTERSQSPARYHTAAIVLHWLLAGLLVYQFALGLRLDELKGSDKFVAFQLHKSIGITVLLLSLARAAMRQFVPRPAEFGAGAQKLAAKLVHWGFYAVMLLGPLTGWIVVSTAKIKLPTMLFGVVPWPHLPLPAAFNEPADLAHTVLVWSLPALILLHVAGVLYHWRLRDEVPGRMLTKGLPQIIAIGAGLLWLVASAGFGNAGTLPNLW